MPGEEEETDDFLGMWRKKVAEEMESPSAIGETLDKLDKLEKENEVLRKKIGENIKLIQKSEEFIRKAVDEKKRLQTEKEELRKKYNNRIENLENKIDTLNRELSLKVDQLNNKDNQINKLNIQINELKSIDQSPPDVNATLIEDLQSELSKKKSHVQKLIDKITLIESNMNELTKNNESLKANIQQLESQGSGIQTQENTTLDPSSNTLETLCQDLQSELNKYKTLTDSLKNENQNLRERLEKEGRPITDNSQKINALRKENEKLKNKIEEYQNQIALQKDKNVQKDDIQKKVNKLSQIIEEKDQLIDSLQNELEERPVKTVKGPMSDLVEDLQKKINKLKLDLKEKDQLIESLK